VRLGFTPLSCSHTFGLTRSQAELQRAQAECGAASDAAAGLHADVAAARQKAMEAAAALASEQHEAQQAADAAAAAADAAAEAQRRLQATLPSLVFTCCSTG